MNTELTMDLHKETGTFRDIGNKLGGKYATEGDLSFRMYSNSCTYFIGKMIS